MVSVLSAAGLAHVYPRGVRALDGIDLDLQAEELLVVIGPNGSGKSTLLGALAGLIAPTGGTVTLLGRPVLDWPQRERARQLAVVPQSLPALPEVVAERFVLGGRYARIDRWRGPADADRAAVERALLDADVGELGDRRLAELSGGQRQRVLIARALAQEASVLLVDEPTAALDLGHQVRVFELLAGLACAGRAALVVTHDVNLAAQYARRIALLDRGRLVALGPPAEILRPEVLVPVYGRHLHFGSLPAPDGRPFVLPWKHPAGKSA